MEKEIETVDTGTTEKEPEVVEEADEKESEDDAQESEVEKPKETLEARRARLQRELKRTNQKLGIDEEAEKPAKKSKNKQDEFGLLEKTYLRSAGIVDSDEVELARNLAKKIGIPFDELVDDDYFKTKLEALRESKTNAVATSNVKGGGGGESNAKNTPEYWIAKNAYPTKEQVPDRKARYKIMNAILANSRTGGKQFYNS